jgi:hypothetical protein
MLVTIPRARSSLPILPAGLTNVVLMATLTPVMYCPRVATARLPTVSVRDMISPAVCTLSVCAGEGLKERAHRRGRSAGRGMNVMNEVETKG